MYAIREGGEVELFDSHWGALSVPQDVFWGPARAEVFIRGHERREEWLDDVWGEGGVGLDKDRRRCVWYGGEGLDGPLLALFLRLMRALWGRDGWTVEHVAGMPEVAEAVGCDPEPLRAPPSAPEVKTIAESAARYAESGYACALVRAAGEGGAPREFVASYSIGWILNAGSEAVVGGLEGLPTLARYRQERAKGAPLFDLWQGAWIDPGARALVVARGVGDEELGWIRAAWPGWDVRREASLDSLFEASGEAVPADLRRAPEEVPAPPSEEEMLAEIAAILFDRERPDMAAMVRRIVDENGGTANPRALVNPRSGAPAADDCERLFALAVAELRRSST